MELIQNLINIVKDNWDKIILVYLAVHKLIVTLRDVLDRTPDSDDNILERIVTLSGKLADYLIKGKRPA